MINQKNSFNQVQLVQEAKIAWTFIIFKLAKNIIQNWNHYLLQIKVLARCHSSKEQLAERLTFLKISI